jgi:hypothetical protein
MVRWWKAAIAIFAGAAIGAAITAGFAAHRTREILLESLDLVQRVAQTSHELRFLQARRDLASVEALRSDRVDDAIAELESRIERHIAAYSDATDGTDEAKLLAELRAYRERHPYQPPAPARGSSPLDPSELLASARVLPVFASGKMIGIRVSAIAPGSRWDSLGVRNEDVVTEVAGLRLDSPSSAVQMFQLFATHSDLALLRDGPSEVRLVAREKRE